MSVLVYKVVWSNECIAEGLTRCPVCDSSLSRAGFGIAAYHGFSCQTCKAGCASWD